MKLNYFNILFNRSSDADVSRLFARGSSDKEKRERPRCWAGFSPTTKPTAYIKIKSVLFLSILRASFYPDPFLEGPN